jgi:hypothetical protein
MKKFISMVLCLSVLTATPVFSMTKEEKKLEEEFQRICMTSIRSDPDLQRISDDLQKLWGVGCVKKKREEEKNVMMCSLPAKAAFFCAGVAVVVLAICKFVIASWFDSYTRGSS